MPPLSSTETAMLLKFSDASTNYDPYPNFKIMVNKLCPNGADVFYQRAPASGADWTSGLIGVISAFSRGCCNPIEFKTGSLLIDATHTSAAEANLLIDFPDAIELPKWNGFDPTIEV